MVEFFAPWCPACVTFLPHLETLKEANADLPLTVVKVFFYNDHDHYGGGGKPNLHLQKLHLCRKYGCWQWCDVSSSGDDEEDDEEIQVNTDDDPELKELFSVNTFPRILLWSKR